MPIMGGSKGVMYLAAAPTVGTDAVNSMVIGGTPSGGSSFILNVFGFQTPAILWSSTNATLLAAIQAALDAVPGVGTNGIVATAGGAPALTAGVGQVLLTFSGANVSKRTQSTITVVSPPAGGTLAITESTPGVTMNPFSPRKGALVVDENAGALLQNTGTASLPVWTPR
jgi:hypothetical protein